MHAGEEAGGAGRIQHTGEQLHKGSPRPHKAPSNIKTFPAKPNDSASETRKWILSTTDNWLFYNNVPILNFSCSLSFPLLLRVNASPKNSDGHFSTICKGSAYLTPSLSVYQVSTLLPSSQQELSLWGEPTKLLHCDGKYVPGILNPGIGHGLALHKEAFKILCEVLLLLTWSIPRLNRHSSFSDLDLSDCSSLFWIHAEPSTPNLHICRANHQEVLLLVTALDHSKQYTHKLLHRQGICASWKMGDTGDRTCVVNPRKVQGQEELVSQLPMNTPITEPLQEKDTPPPLTCKCLLWHRELLMEMRCQVGRISLFYGKVSEIYEMRVKAGLDDGVNYTEQASFIKK